MSLLFLLAVAQAAPVAPHASYDKLVTANGHGAFVFANDRLADGFPHLYQALDPDTWTPELLHDSYFGLSDGNGNGSWLTDTRETGTDPGTGIVTIRRRDGPLEITEYAFAPMDAGAPLLAQVLRVRNTGTQPEAVGQLTLLANWHAGGLERVRSSSAERWKEEGTNGVIEAFAPGASDVSCVSVYDTVRAGGRIGGGCDTSGNDLVPAFGWRFEALPPGAEVWIGAVSSLSGTPDAWVAGRSPQAWVEAEQSWWSAFHDEHPAPSGLDDTEQAVYQQALAFLVMGQVREAGAPFGQIPASLPLSAPVGDFQHVWNITWVRDASYAAVALARAGLPERALEAIAFLAQPGTTGEWEAYVGGPHAVSVCRTYGDGTEWTDPDADGPNIEFDNFGLWLWALGEVWDAGAEPTEALVETALDGVADVLIRLIDPNTGLLLPDSSIWERHWNGNQQRFTYSSAWAVQGLRVAARLAEARGDTRAEMYRVGADRIAEAIPEHLVDSSGVVAASQEQLVQGDDYLDLAAVEVFNLGILPATGEAFDASLKAWDEGLRVASGSGFARNDDGSAYDRHEWIMIDLRLAEALRRGCRPEEASALEAWVAGTAHANHDILPELLEPERGDFAGPAPMLGFGAGAWVLAMQSRDEADAACVTATQPPPPTAPLGCGCSTPPGPRPWALLAMIPALALLRRRRSA
jgi:MYXO-CTERM domain-containing protein